MLEIKNTFEQLKADIMRLEGFRSRPAGNISGQVDPIQQAFHNAVFPTGSTHEFLLSATENLSATGAFISTIVSRWMDTTGAVVWISNEQKLLPNALEPFGIPPDRFIFATVKRDKDLLWVTEEALKCAGVGAVICEVNRVSFTESRRLQLAVEQSRTTGFIIRYDRVKPAATAFVSRWRIAQIPSDSIDNLPGIGFPKWKVELLRVRNGRPGSWNVQWSEQKLHYLADQEHSQHQSAKVG